MSTPVIIDGVLVLVVFLGMAMGWKRGLFRSLMSLAVVVVAALLSVQLSRLATDVLIEKGIRPSVMEALEEQVDTIVSESAVSSRMEEMEQLVEAIPNEFLREQAEKLLDGLSLSSGEVKQSTRRELLAAGQEMVDTVLDSVVRGMVQGILCALLFSILCIGLRIALRVINGAFRIPVLKQLNQFGGLVLGGVEGVALAWLGIWVVRQLDLIPQEELAQSWILGFLSGV